MRFGTSNITRGPASVGLLKIAKLQPVGVTPGADEIAIVSGNGYIGSTYMTGTTGGQWYADETAISGQTADTYVMTEANEGKSITYRRNSGTILSNSIRMWTPKVLGSLVAGWYDAYTSTNITLVSNAASQWTSKAPTPVNATQTTANKRPVYTVDGLSAGRNALVANGTSHQLLIQGQIAMNDQTVIAAMKTTDNRSATWFDCPGIWGGEVGGTPADFGFGVRGGYPVYGATSSNNYIGTTLVNTGNPMLLGYTRRNSNGEVNFLYNTANVGNFLTTAGIRNAPTTTSLFCMNSLNITSPATAFLNGAIGEILMISSVLVPVDLKKLEGYIAWRWNLVDNLPSNHTYKNSPPGA